MPIKIVLAGVALAATTAATVASCQPPSATPPSPAPQVVVHDNSDDGDVQTGCDDNGNPIDIQPNTAAGRTRAAELCASGEKDVQIIQSYVNTHS